MATVFAVPSIPRSHSETSAARARRAEAVSNAREMLSEVSASGSTATPVPRASTRRAFSSWSPPKGTTMSGLPVADDDVGSKPVDREGHVPSLPDHVRAEHAERVSHLGVAA